MSTKPEKVIPLKSLSSLSSHVVDRNKLLKVVKEVSTTGRLVTTVSLSSESILFKLMETMCFTEDGLYWIPSTMYVSKQGIWSLDKKKKFNPK